MTWFRIDDSWGTHPKVIAAGLKGRMLWLYGGLHCAQHLTDGRISKGAVKVIAAQAEVPTSMAKLLVDVGLWTDEGDHYLMNDYLSYQPSREKVLAERKAAADRQQRARDKARESQQKSRRDSRVSNAVSHGPPDPTRPDHALLEVVPTTTNQRAVTRRVAEVIDAWARIEFEHALETQLIGNEDGYLATIRRRLMDEQGEHVRRVVEAHMDATVKEQLAIAMGEYDEGAVA